MLKYILRNRAKTELASKAALARGFLKTHLAGAAPQLIFDDGHKAALFRIMD